MVATKCPQWRLARRPRPRPATPPPVEQLWIERITRARPGPRRRDVVRRMAMCIGERVRPGPPAADHWARERWEELRRAELLRQIDMIRVLWRGSKGDGEAIAMGDGKAETTKEGRSRRDRRIRELSARGEPVASICRLVGCSRSTVVRALGRMRSG